MNKRNIQLISILSLLSLGVCFDIANSKEETKSLAYSKTKVSNISEINLNDSTEQEIREYYSSLGSNLSGNDLLKALKPILSNNQEYFAYDGSSSLWEMYEIVNRDWELSPANQLSGSNGTYDEANNVIHDYAYGKSGSNPYVHMLYRDYENFPESSKGKAWDSHINKTGVPGMNQEHVWPKSWGFENVGEGGARGDPHNLIAGDASVNCLLHNNYAYGYVDTSDPKTKAGTTFDFAWNNYLGVSTTLKENKNENLIVFEPQDSDKGDIARACFYMVARYNNLANSTTEEFSGDNPNLMLSDDISYEGSKPASIQSDANNPVSYGILSDLLEWNHLDPVDEYERYRNDLIYNNYSHNRNPFIDFPDWADIAFGDSGDFANPNTDYIHEFKPSVDIPLNDFEVEDIDIALGTKQKINISFDPINTTHNKVTWEIEDNSIVDINSKNVLSAKKVGETNVKATIDSKSKTFKVTVYYDGIIEFDLASGKTSSNPNKITWKSSDNKVSFTQNKGFGSSVNFDYIVNPRLYKGNYFEINSLNNYLIKKVEIFYKDNTNAKALSCGLTIDQNNVVKDDSINVTLSSSVDTPNVISCPEESSINTLYIQNIEDSTSAYSTLIVDKFIVTLEKVDNPLKSLQISGNFKKDYYLGDEFDSTNLVVKKEYDDGLLVNVTDEATINAPELIVPGDNEVDISYFDEGEQQYINAILTINVYDAFKVKISKEDIGSLSYSEKGHYGKRLSNSNVPINFKYYGINTKNSSGSNLNYMTFMSNSYAYIQSLSGAEEYYPSKINVKINESSSSKGKVYASFLNEPNTKFDDFYGEYFSSKAGNTLTFTNKRQYLSNWEIKTNSADIKIDYVEVVYFKLGTSENSDEENNDNNLFNLDKRTMIIAAAVIVVIIVIVLIILASKKRKRK